MHRRRTAVLSDLHAVAEVLDAVLLEFPCKLRLVDLRVLPHIDLARTWDIMDRDLRQPAVVDLREKGDAFIKLEQREHDYLLVDYVVHLRRESREAAVVHLDALHVIAGISEEEALR